MRAAIQQQFARRLSHLRQLLPEDPAAVGDQGLKLLEEYLEQLARRAGYRDDVGSIGRYATFLRRRGPLSLALLERAEGYAQVRNCLAHSYGLQTSPDLAREILKFLGELIGQDGLSAQTIISGELLSVNLQTPLREARDLMLRQRFSRLPVRDQRGWVVGLLTDRDIVAAEAAAEQADGLLGNLTVGDALPKNTGRRFRVIEAAAEYEAIRAALQHPGVEALIVTTTGARDLPPLGIITHADLLYRMG